MARYVSLFFKLGKMALTSGMSYRVQFFFSLFGGLLNDFLALLTSALVYAAGSGFPGWTFAEYLIFFGSYSLVWHLSAVSFSRAHERLGYLVESGELDTVLIRPINFATYSLIKHPEFESLFGAAAGLALLVYGFFLQNTVPSLSAVLSFVVLVASGITFLGSLSLFMAIFFLFFVRASFIQGIMRNVKETAMWPITIYNSPLRFIFTFIFPMGLAAFYPASAILGRVSLKLTLALTLVSIIFFALVYAAFNFSLRKYSSGGG